jgi:hypothetical protein
MKMTLEQKVLKCIAAHPDYTDHQIARNCRTNKLQVAHIRSKASTPHATPSSPTPITSDEALLTGGLVLGRCRVLSRKPSDSASKFIKRLPTGRGFDVRTLSKEWGMSEDTIKRHAKDLGCFKFVEVSDDEWIPMVMNPETANKYNA